LVKTIVNYMVQDKPGRLSSIGQDHGGNGLEYQSEVFIK